MSLLQNLNVVRGDMSKRQGWGWHDVAAWQTFFDKVHELGQVKNPVKAEDVVTNDLIAGANDFDHEKVKADALAVELPADLAAVDVEAVKAKLFDQAIPG
jgi:NitT/TauT family transport system substrate-binding protein